MKHIQGITVTVPAKADEEKGYVLGCGILKNSIGKCGPVMLE